MCIWRHTLNGIQWLVQCLFVLFLWSNNHLIAVVEVASALSCDRCYLFTAINHQMFIISPCEFVTLFSHIEPTVLFDLWKRHVLQTWPHKVHGSHYIEIPQIWTQEQGTIVSCKKCLFWDCTRTHFNMYTIVCFALCHVLCHDIACLKCLNFLLGM